MRAPLSWLAEFVDLPEIPVEELSERLTIAGIEVERVQPCRAEGAVVARVVSVQPHPTADTLSVCAVDTGSGTRTVVCGADNVVAGGNVPLGLPGARLPGGTLSAATIRGVKSDGMILSRQELGLEERSTGIWILPPGLEVGADLGPLIGFPDTVLSLKITSNRPDLLGIVGIAREIAALYRTAFREPSVQFREADPPASGLAGVEIEDPADCPRYVARVIRGVDARPSPLPMESRLLKCRLRPLSLIVDATNYVLLELGHPLHAFDRRPLAEDRIVVRRARSGERIRTLDGADHALSPEVLVIADARRPVALAGVMGGAETEVGADTGEVLLEAAAFSPVRVRRSARALGMRTEASLRFERGLSPEMADLASRRCCAVLTRHGPAEIATGSVDAYPKPAGRRTIPLRKARIAEVLGAEIPPGEAEESLSLLGLSIKDQGPTWEATVPSFRPDLAREVDLIEEVARLYGYDRIAPATPHVGPRIGRKDPGEAFADRVRLTLASLGLLEICSIGLVPRAEAQVELRNALAKGWDGLRPDLVGGLLAAVKGNLEAQAPGVALFEVGRVFTRPQGQIDEHDRVAVALAGRRPTPLSGKGEYGPAELKGVLDSLLAALRVEDAELGEIEDPRLHPHRRAGVYLSRGPSPADRDPSDHGPQTPDPGSRALIGWFGELAPELTADLPGEPRVLALELQLEPLRALARPPSHRPLPRSPASKRDLSLLISEAVPEGKVRATILAGPWVESAFLYDLYRGEGVPEGHLSLTYEVTFRDRERTLASADVDRAVGEILDQLKPLGARLRT